MTDLNDIANLITRADHNMRNNTRHEVHHSDRIDIYSSIVNMDNKNANSEAFLSRRLTTLAIQTINYVLPVWEEAWQNNYSPHRVLYSLKLRLIDKKHTDNEYQIDNDDIEDDEVDISSTNSIIQERANIVMKSAILVYRLANKGNISLKSLSLSQDFALLASHSLPNENNSLSQDKTSIRQKYWEWWLTKAIPAAIHNELPDIKPFE